MTFLAQAWPAITTIVAIALGVAAYRKQMLEIQELNLKLKKLESEAFERDRRVYEPTPQEIKIYSEELRSNQMRFAIREAEKLEKRRSSKVVAFTFLCLILLLALVSYEKSKFDLLQNELKAQQVKIEELKRAIEENQKQKK